MGDDDNRYGEVLTLSTSDVYHFKSPESQTSLSNESPACQLSNMIDTSNKLREISLEQALNQGKERCTECIRCIRTFSDIEIKECELCGMVDVVVSSEFETMDVEDTPSTPDKVDVCAECIIRLNYLYDG